MIKIEFYKGYWNLAHRKKYMGIELIVISLKENLWGDFIIYIMK